MSDSQKLNPRLLDLVMRDDDYVIYYGDHALRSPAGNDIACNNQRLLRYLLIELSLAGELPLDIISGFSLFSYTLDHFKNGDDNIGMNIDKLIMDDAFARIKLGHEKTREMQDVNNYIRFLEDHDQFLNFAFHGITVITEVLNNYILSLNNSVSDVLAMAPQKLTDLLSDAYNRMSPEKKSAIHLLFLMHDAVFVLPLLLVEKKINPAEYSNALFALHMRQIRNAPDRMKKVKELFPSENPENIKVPDWNDPSMSFSRVHLDALKVLEFVSYFDFEEEEKAGVRQLIDQGESYSLEFKSTLRWDLYQDKKNPAIEHASLKTIAAFLNSAGGNLLIGVKDDGGIQGIETDRFDTEDKFLLHFWNLIKSSIGQEFTQYVSTSLDNIEGKTVCLVKCLRSPGPVFLKQKGFDEEFYIRVGPSSASLEIREALKYIGERFVDQ
jgi:hypothetical protein